MGKRERGKKNIDTEQGKLSNDETHPEKSRYIFVFNYVCFNAKATLHFLPLRWNENSSSREGISNF